MPLSTARRATSARKVSTLTGISSPTSALLSALGTVADALRRPLLAGMSRKSMATRLLGIDAADALPATSALNMLALERGASILRVHDVAEAVQVVEMYTRLCGSAAEKNI